MVATSCRSLPSASVVCGFNSTALCETIAAGRPVVLPWFAEASSADVKPFILDLRGVCVTAGSHDELQSRLIDLAREPRPVPAALTEVEQEMLVKWTGNADGLAAGRARKGILAEIR